MIELDEPVVLPQGLEYARCTCLDRARIALEQSGQHWCAGVMGDLQARFNELAEEYELNPNDPVGILKALL